MTNIMPLNKTRTLKQAPSDGVTYADVALRYQQATGRRQNWETLWQDCYDFTLPGRGEFRRSAGPGQAHTQQIFDGTAMDAVDQLAASLLGNLTPPWMQWFGLRPGPDLPAREAYALAPVLERAGQRLQAHFDRSNFAVEMHQCFLDLVIGGTASLFFEETMPGDFSAFRFAAAPLSDVALEEGVSGRLDGTFRELSLTYAQLKARYVYAELPAQLEKLSLKEPQRRYDILEAILPEETGTRYLAFLREEGMSDVTLLNVRLPVSPVINSRWQKSPGEIYGRSPVMKALPDIKTANKVVELTLKNASIAVSGIWQADDDGVLNTSNIQLKPGTIIPRAVGSRGLAPLEMPGRFDVSQLVLEDLRVRIRHALLTDKLGPLNAPRMTATEVLERAAEMALLLGATYGRLQSELLTPLIQRGFAILRRRGVVPDVLVDGRTVMIDYRSPLATAQSQRSVQNTLSWLNTVLAMGPETANIVDLQQAARRLAEALGVPGDLIRSPLPPENATEDQTRTVEHSTSPNN